MKNILIFEAHSDDCVIGMGGTVQKMIAEGYSPVLITFTSGDTAYSTLEEKESIVEIRKKENENALKILGITEHINWNYGCQAVENTREVHQRCIEMIRKFQPELIFTHSPIDKHRDHRAISDTVTEAWWKATEGVLADKGAPFRAEKLYYFETTELFPHPDVIIDITPYFEKKIDAMREFKSQTSVMKDLFGYVEGMAQVRSLYVPGSAGEAFVKSDFFPSLDF